MYLKKVDLQLTYTCNGKWYFSIHQLCCCCHWGNEWVTWRRTWSFKNVHWPHSGSHQLWFENTTLLLWYLQGILSAITGFQHWHDSSTICSKTTEIKSAHAIQLLFVAKLARRSREEGVYNHFNRFSLFSATCCWLQSCCLMMLCLWVYDTIKIGHRDKNIYTGPKGKNHIK